jgi:hypothetical protein
MSSLNEQYFLNEQPLSSFQFNFIKRFSFNKKEGFFQQQKEYRDLIDQFDKETLRQKYENGEWRRFDFEEVASYVQDEMGNDCRDPYNMIGANYRVTYINQQFQNVIDGFWEYEIRDMNTEDEWGYYDWWGIGTFKKGRREGVHIYIKNEDYNGLQTERNSWRNEGNLKDHLKQAQAVIDVFQRESDKMFLRYIVKGNIGSLWDKHKSGLSRFNNWSDISDLMGTSIKLLSTTKMREY